MSAYILYLWDSRTSGLPASIEFESAESCHTSYELFEALKTAFGNSVEYWEVVNCVELSSRYVLLVDETGLYRADYGLNICALTLYGQAIVGGSFVLVRNDDELDFLTSADVEIIRSFLSSRLGTDVLVPVVKWDSLGLPDN